MHSILFPGSFDPVTIGHENIVRRALLMFDRVVVAIGDNPRKQCRFPIEQRIQWLKATFADCPNVEIDSYSTLTIDYCRQKKIRLILRGIRDTTDFAYESHIATTNKMLTSEIETIFLQADPHLGAVSSSMVKELLDFGHNVSELLPIPIRDEIA